MPPRATRHRTPDRGMQVLEQKLSILALGPSQTRRNPALDVLTGRVPDERLQSLQASLITKSAPLAAENGLSGAASPTAMVLPIAAIRMAAVARSSRPGLTPWLQPSSVGRTRLRLVSPPPSRLSQVPWLGPLLQWLKVERRLYRSTVRSPRAHPAS